MGLITFTAGQAIGSARQRSNRRAADRRHRERMAASSKSLTEAQKINAGWGLGVAPAALGSAIALSIILPLMLIVPLLAIALMAIPAIPAIWLAGFFIPDHMYGQAPHVLVNIGICLGMWAFIFAACNKWVARSGEDIQDVVPE